MLFCCIFRTTLENAFMPLCPPTFLPVICECPEVVAARYPLIPRPEARRFAVF